MAVSGPDNIFADHGSSGGGGGCSGDCIPPTLGQDNYGQVFVTNGLVINDNPFDVAHFQQEMTPQILQTDKPATISLKIFENTGPSYLTHVFLMLGQEEKTISGVKVPSHPVEIVWERPLNEKPSVTVNDPDNFVSDVSVDANLAADAFGNEDMLTEIVFKFTPSKKFDTDIVLVEMWDFENNSWTNYFHNSVIIDDSESKLSVDVESQPEIPNWFKNNAGFWAQNQIDDETFLVGIKFLIEQKIMNIPNLQKFQLEPVLHFIDVEKGVQHYLDRYYYDDVYRDWFDSNFPEYTIEEAVGINVDHNPAIPNWIKNNAQLWTDDMITDDDFLGGIKFLVESGIILL
jgi:hypothetical protein